MISSVVSSMATQRMPSLFVSLVGPGIVIHPPLPPCRLLSQLCFAPGLSRGHGFAQSDQVSNSHSHPRPPHYIATDFCPVFDYCASVYHGELKGIADERV